MQRAEEERDVDVRYGSMTLAAMLALEMDASYVGVGLGQGIMWTMGCRCRWGGAYHWRWKEDHVDVVQVGDDSSDRVAMPAAVALAVGIHESMTSLYLIV